MTFNKKVAVIGDSISAGYPLEINQVYTKLIQNGVTQYSAAFYQFCVGGNMTNRALAMAQNIYAYGVNPNMVILAMGINDAGAAVDPTTIANNLEQAALYCMGKGTPVVIGNIDLTAWADITPAGYPAAFNAALTGLINKYGFMIFPFLDARTLATGGQFCIDRIHPNAAGHVAIATDLIPKVTEVLRVAP